jgi:hypothetical protein
MAQHCFFWTQMNAHYRRRLIRWFAALLLFLIISRSHIYLSGSWTSVVSAGRTFPVGATSSGLQNW